MMRRVLFLPSGHPIVDECGNTHHERVYSHHSGYVPLSTTTRVCTALYPPPGYMLVYVHQPGYMLVYVHQPGYVGRLYPRVCREAIPTLVYTTLYYPGYTTMPPYLPVPLYTEPSSAGRQSPGLKVRRNPWVGALSAPHCDNSVTFGMPFCA